MKANQTDSWGWDEALAMFGGEDALLASASQHDVSPNHDPVLSRGSTPFIYSILVQIILRVTLIGTKC
jgi:hypothetical protein